MIDSLNNSTVKHVIKMDLLLLIDSEQIKWSPLSDDMFKWRL